MTCALSDQWAPDGWSIGADRDEEALDRALRLAEKRSFPASRELWLKERDLIYEAIMARGNTFLSLFFTFIAVFLSQVISATATAQPAC